MAISFVGAAAAAGTTLTLPTNYQSGDLMIMFAYTSTSVTPATVPAGWTNWYALQTLNANTGIIGYKFAGPTGTETAGTWTGATQLAVGIYRGTRGSMTASNGGNSNATIAVPAIGTTSVIASGSDWRISVAGHVTATNVYVGPAGMTSRISSPTNIYFGDSNGPANPDTGYGLLSWTVNATSGWTGATIYLRAAKQEMNNFEQLKAQGGMSVTERPFR